MITYTYIRTTLGDIVTAYPHDPYDDVQSVNDWLAAKAATGIKLQSFSVTDGGNWYFIFKDKD